jgi:hypothetical protein
MRTGYHFVDLENDDESATPNGNGADKTADDKPLAFCDIASWAEYEPPDWTYRSRRPASALWMTQAKSFGK